MTSDEIKATYAMRDILIRYGMQPNRAGFIPCPFHKGDREPSMKIYKDGYNCFACGANGDIFSFIQKHEGISFKQAYLELGGTYEERKNESRFCRQRKVAELKRIRRETEEKERAFEKWRMQRLGQVCRLLQLCDNAEGVFQSFTWEWAELISMRQKNEYKYNVLCFGSRDEQEEMRRLNE